MIAPSYAPDLGDVASHVGQLAHALALRDHHVTVYTAADRASVARLGEISRTRIGSGVLEVQRFPRPLRRSSQRPSPAIALAMRERLWTFDVVHAHGYHGLPPLLARAALRHRRPLVVSPHYEQHVGRSTTGIVRRLYDPWGRSLMARADWIIATGRSEANLLATDFGLSVSPKTVLISTPPSCSRPSADPRVWQTVAERVEGVYADAGQLHG